MQSRDLSERGVLRNPGGSEVLITGKPRECPVCHGPMTYDAACKTHYCSKCDRADPITGPVVGTG